MKTLIVATFALFLLTSCEKSEDFFGNGKVGINLFDARISDPNNNPVADAVVEVYANRNDHVAFATAITDEKGICHIRKAPKMKRFRISKAGFQTVSIDIHGAAPSAPLNILLQREVNFPKPQ